MRKAVARIMLFLLIFGNFCFGSAEETLPLTATAYATPVDASLRVWLQSLGPRTALGLTVAGAYSVDGDRGFQFEPGTEIKLGLEKGSIILQAGGASIDMGGGFALVRHLDGQGKAGGVYIHESEKDTLYCGDISFSVTGGESLRVIVTLDIEEYLLGVVPYEMSDTFPLEALKAQAVAARSYGMQRKQTAMELGQDYDIVDTTNDQVYKGYDARYTRPIQAIKETRGIVGMIGDQFAELFYSASNGGQTALAADVWGRGDFGYLDMRDDPYDIENPDSVVRKATIPKAGASLQDPLKTLLTDGAAAALTRAKKLAEGDTVTIDAIRSIEGVAPAYGGDSRQYTKMRFSLDVTVQHIKEDGTPGEKEALPEQVSVDLSYYDELRTALNIGINTQAYDLATVTELEGSFLIVSRRYGHGVGLSQRGAQQMAGQYGMSYLDILGFYYPGLELKQVTWTEKQLMKAAALPESLGYAAARPTPAPTPAPLPKLAKGEYYAVVTVEGVDSTLNVREAPSTEDEIVGVIRTGARLIVMEELETGWARMKTAELTGYVRMDFITREDALPVATPTPKPEGAALPEDTIFVF